MRKTGIRIGMFSIGICLLVYITRDKKAAAQLAVSEYLKDVDTLNFEVSKLLALVKTKGSEQQLQGQFLVARSAYKKTEWLAEYYYPNTAKSINGPAIPEVEPDEKTKIIAPEGFQVIEELLFPAYDTGEQNKLLQETKILASNANRLKYVATTLETTDAHIFDALRLQIFRIITLGTSGFDSPVAHNSIREAFVSVESIKKYYTLYAKETGSENKATRDTVNRIFNESLGWLSKQKDFNSFDRMFLIRQYLNPLSKNLWEVQKQLKLPVFTEPRFLKADATTLFANNIFDPNFYTPSRDAYSNSAKVDLGSRLFYEGILSGDKKRSCATCHQPEKAFTDGLKTSLAITRKNVLRNSPTLLNASLQPSLFYDMRVDYLEDQAKDVIMNKDEMHGSFENALLYISKDKTYKALFSKVYPGERLTETHIKNAIASYIRSLVSLNSRFDKYMRGDESAMNEMEVNGFNLFMGKAKCGTCHFVPLFNGNNPPGYHKTDAEVIGVPASPDTIHPVLDSDKGKYNLYDIDIHKHAFKTPTLRNIGRTAPYMHNGVYKSLEEVVDFYDRGGGAG